MKKFLIVFLFMSINSELVFSQAPFNITLSPIEISGIGGLQSYAVGTHDGKWLIVGGRLDGLHRRQPWASFDLAGHNDQLWVLDPLAQQFWTSPLSSLPLTIQEQLRSSNMEFYQEGNRLYVIGGYGYSAGVADHTTFPFLTAINIPEVIEVIINGGNLAPLFRQIEDEQFAVTGGYLERIGETFHLVGGQRFDGRYNPMDMPTFTQEYTNAIRKFLISDDGTTITITHLAGWVDAENLHRRDFNVLPQIMPNGNEGLTAFSGVFQSDADIPYLDCVNITDNEYAVQPNFSQYYNHYHCASIPIYSALNQEMHSLFFGGIAQYYEENGDLVMDDEVPFVKTIARVMRTSDGIMTEYKLPFEMPGYLGSGAEFIPLQSLATYNNGVIDLDAINSNTLIGYIYGGIESSAKNIFWINDGTQSEANSAVYAVYLSPSEMTGLDEINPQSNAKMRMQLYPNGQTGSLYIDLILDERSEIIIQLCDIKGRILAEGLFDESLIHDGENNLEMKTDALDYGQIYIVIATSEIDTISQKMIIND